MNPAPIETAPIQATSIDVAVAVLTEKVTQVIGDHERRISALELVNTNRPTRGATLMGPVIAGLAFAVIVADKVRWN